jgi:hypothetical protein
VTIAAAAVVVASMVLATGVASAVTARPAGMRSSVAPRTGNTFPHAVWSVRTGRIAFSSPTVATIDGMRAVVIGSLSGYVYVMNAVTGAELPGWPQPVRIQPGVATAVESAPTVAYLDGPNREPSIIVGAGSLYEPNQDGGVEAFYYNGRKRFVFRTRATTDVWGSPGGGNYSNPVFSTPAVGDVTGHGQQDIVFGSYDHYIYALTPSGAMVPGFPFNNVDTIWSSPALYDAAHTGVDDIYIGADSTGLDGCWGGWLYDLRYYDGAPHVVWKHCEPQTVWSSPAIGEINSSGRAAVVVGTSWNTIYGTPGTSDKVYAYYADDGAPVPGWPVDTNGPTFGSPAIGDILGNGQPEVVDTVCAHCSNGPGQVEAWTGSGHELWTRTVAPQQMLGSPILVDLNGSGYNDVVAGSTWGLYLLNGRTGGLMYHTARHPLGGPCAVDDTPAVTEIPGVGWRLFMACGGPLPSHGTVEAFPLPVAPRTAPAWPEFRGDAAHTGVADDPATPTDVSCKPPATSNGYRFVAADGGIFDYGGLPFCGSTGNLVLGSPIVGMATTPDGGGYWLVTANGSVFAFGNAHLAGGGAGLIPYGSLQGLPIAGTIVGIVSSSDGHGYYLVGSDGSVYAFGDARYLGSEANQPLNFPVVAMVRDTRTGGYWLVGSDGGIFSFHAPFYGSTGGIRLRRPIVGMAQDPLTGGYWFVASDGGIFAYHAQYFGSMGHKPLTKPIVGMAADRSTGGYWLVGSDGGIFAFGARYFGSTGGIRLNQTIDGMASG